MINDSLIDPYAINGGAHNGNRLPDDSSSAPFTNFWPNFICISYFFTILVCIFGILGNGMVIRLLGFCIKRSPFTIFILNLAVADFGVLISIIMSKIVYFSVESYILGGVFLYIFHCTFSTSQMLLTVISADRCVSVFFPLWHRCHRPTWLSPVVCSLSWILSSLATATEFISRRTGTYGSVLYFISEVVMYIFVANGFLCIPLMTISSLMLFLKVCCKSRQQRRQKLLTTILVTVSFFLFCCIPFYTFMFMLHFTYGPHGFILDPFIFACLNSSMNPLIYYLVGRQKKKRSNNSMKGVLQNLFKEEET